jgi:hypothetical protein
LTSRNKEEQQWKKIEGVCCTRFRVGGGEEETKAQDTDRGCGTTQSIHVVKGKCACTEPTTPYLEFVWGYAAAVDVALVGLTIPLSLGQHLINTLETQQRTYTQHSAA